jgi:hypothetical protein
LVLGLDLKINRVIKIFITTSKKTKTMVQILKRGIIYVCLLIFFINVEVKSQEDTIIDQSSAKKSLDIDKEDSPKYNYLDENLREEKALFKLFVQPYFKNTKNTETYGGISGSIAYEQKIIPSLSVLFSNQFGVGFFNSYSYLDFGGDIDIRYYYSINKRIKESVGANNFHSNYFSIGLSKLYQYMQGFYGTPENYQTFEQWYFKPNLKISWGMQRRIGKLGFYDIEPYVNFQRFSEWYLGLNLKLGLAWGF